MANRKELLEQLEAQARERYLQLQSADEIKAFLKENGAYQRDIDRIYRTVNRDVRKEFSEQVEAKILAGETIDQIRPQIEGKLPDDILDQVIGSGQQLANRAVQRKVNQLVDQGRSVQDIVKECELPAVDAASIIQWVEARHRQLENREVEEEGGGAGSIAFGLILIVGGVVATMASNSIWYGAVIYGIYLVAKGAISSR
ncbi:MAG: hypothetical protein AAFY48_12970 [Bacteroidota bacterium]